MTQNLETQKARMAMHKRSKLLQRYPKYFKPENNADTS